MKSVVCEKGGWERERERLPQFATLLRFLIFLLCLALGFSSIWRTCACATTRPSQRSRRRLWRPSCLMRPARAFWSKHGMFVCRQLFTRLNVCLHFCLFLFVLWCLSVYVWLITCLCVWLLFFWLFACAFLYVCYRCDESGNVILTAWEGKSYPLHELVANAKKGGREERHILSYYRWGCFKFALLCHLKKKRRE